MYLLMVKNYAYGTSCQYRFIANLDLFLSYLNY